MRAGGTKMMFSKTRWYLIVLIVVLVGTSSCSDEQEAVPAAAPESAEAVGEEEPVRQEEAATGSLAQNIEDASTEASIKKALVESSELRPFDFEAEVKRGSVALRGSVETQAQRNRAAEIALQVEGVREVDNEIAAAEPAPKPEEDDLLAAADTVDAQADEVEREPDQEASDADDTEEEAAAEETYHTVKSGENLWVIARRYGISVSEIQNLNNLGSSSNLQPGDRLRVK